MESTEGRAGKTLEFVERRRSSRAMFSRRSTAALFFLAAVAICGILAPFDVLRSNPSPLRIGINPWPGYEFAYLAAEKGYFENEGLDVRLVEFSSLGDARRAYERGQIDAFFGTAVEVVQSAAQSHRHPRIVLIADYSDGADQVLARREIATPLDLAGKRVGVERASLGGYIAARALESVGRSMGDVTIVHLEQVHMKKSLERGDIDAVVTYPPTALEIARAAGVHEIFSTSMIPGEVLDILAVDAEELSSRPDVAVRIRRAFKSARDLTMRSPDEAFAIMAGREGIAGDVFKESLGRGIRLVDDTEIDDLLRAGGIVEKVLQKTIDVLRRTDQIDPSKKLVASEFLARPR